MAEGLTNFSDSVVEAGSQVKLVNNIPEFLNNVLPPPLPPTQPPYPHPHLSSWTEVIIEEGGGWRIGGGASHQTLLIIVTCDELLHLNIFSLL